METIANSARDVRAVLPTQRIGLPLWAFGNSGTRFKVAQQGVPRDPCAKIADAAQVHRYPGAALHIPWDNAQAGWGA
jgi:L-rhamnose isomerase / sugar isomerase